MYKAPSTIKYYKNIFLLLMRQYCATHTHGVREIERVRERKKEGEREEEREIQHQR